MNSAPFQFKELKPVDILAAANTISTQNVHSLNSDSICTKPRTFLSWAQKGLERQDDFGFDCAVCYAKRAACRVIDGLIQDNYLRPFINSNYPEKIQALCSIGISIPEIIYELIIKRRNEIEHDYKIPTIEQAKHAVQIADLFLRTTDEEFEKGQIIAVDWNVCCTHSANEQTQIVEFQGFTTNPMLFIDVFSEPLLVKIIHPKEREILFTSLDKFTEEESIKFAIKLREHYGYGSRSRSCFGEDVYRELKQKGQF